MACIVFHEFLRGVEKRTFQKIDDRHDLWQVLVMLTNRRSIDQRRQSRALKRSTPPQSPRTVSQEKQAETIAAIASRDPTPEEAALLSDEIKQRLASVGDQRLADIAMAKLQGLTHQEIADQLGCSTRSIERKLAIIRRKWINTGMNS
jgi:RNA polymerase sigma factor (sigma-70 family)